MLDSPVFGRLQWHDADDAWVGTFHSDQLRGWHQASELRHDFKTGSGHQHPVYRTQPGWDVVTGDFELLVRREDDTPPSPEQEALWTAFTTDPDAVADQVLTAIFDWYRDVRPDWIGQMNGDEDEKNATLPEVASPPDLLDFIEFNGVRVLPSTYGNPAPCVILSFGWFDEHGLAARWRNGTVETVGDYDSVEDD